MTVKLVGDVIDSVRSKNAGPFSITFDLFFPDAKTFEAVQATDALRADVIADLYRIPAGDVAVHYFKPCLAVKISIPRDVPCGTPGDRDMLGGQQFTPLLKIPLELG